MKNRFYTFLAVMSCVLLLAYACRHKKTAVSKGRVKKQVTVKASEKPKAVTAAPPAAQDKNESGHAIVRQKLNLSEKELNASRLFLFISDWYGVPYKYGGCQKSGIDCSCFTNLLCDKVYNLKVARSAGDMYNDCEKVPLDEAREGDLVFFKINSNAISHVGVYLRNNLFVHASTSKGVMISSMQEPYFKKYFHAGGRFKSL